MERDKIVEALSKMPFAGRHWVRHKFIKGLEAARGGDHLTKFDSSIAIGAFAVAHIPQVVFGVGIGIDNASEGDTVSAIAAGYDFLYAAANVGVIYTQLNLINRLSNERAVATSPPTEAEGGSFADEDYSRDLVLTVGAQVGFLGTAALSAF